jgi:PUA domain protein
MAKVEVPRKRERRRILQELSSYFDEALEEDNMVIRDTRGKDVIFLDGSLVGIRVKLGEGEEGIYPSIKAITERRLREDRWITVDQGAVPYVCNGADIMAPGVVAVGADVKKKGFVAVKEEKHGGILAVGIALLDRDDAEKAETGKVVKNLHWVGDPIWVLGK